MEREYLTFVARGMTTDEIVRELGKHGLRRSPHTVNEAIASARGKLGGVSRRQAARLVAEGLTPHPMGDRHAPIGVPRPAPNGEQGPAADVGGSCNEERSTFQPFVPVRSEGASWWEPINVGPVVRLMLVAVMLIMLLASVSLVMDSSDGFRRLARAVAPMFEHREDRHE